MGPNFFPHLEGRTCFPAFPSWGRLQQGLGLGPFLGFPSWKQRGGSFSPGSLQLTCLPLSTDKESGLVRLFLTSMSLVIFCFLFSSVDYVPVKDEITWYLSLTVWLISLSIMLSSILS